jgi:predicted DNA-binding transcriptional regulator AlpA
VTNIIRPPAAWRRLGVGKSKFYEDYVRTGLLRSVKLGRRATGFFDDEIDALIEKMRRERDTKAAQPGGDDAIRKARTVRAHNLGRGES